MKTFDIAVIEGDGIGPEVTREAIAAADADGDGNAAVWDDGSLFSDDPDGAAGVVVAGDAGVLVSATFAEAAGVGAARGQRATVLARAVASRPRPTIPPMRVLLERPAPVGAELAVPSDAASTPV